MSQTLKTALSNLAKAAIATFAVVCAALVPRIIAALTTTAPGQDVKLYFLSESYLLLTVLVSALIGVGVMLYTWKQDLDPAKTFTVALSFPALVSGGLSLSASAEELAKKAQETKRYAEQELRREGIPVDSSTAGIRPLSFDGTAPAAKRTASRTPFTLIGVAHAAGGAAVLASDYRPGSILQEPTYYIVLWQTRNQREAKQKLETLRRIAPTARLFQSADRNYLIMAIPEPLPIGAATQRASELKRQLKAANMDTQQLKLIRAPR